MLEIAIEKKLKNFELQSCFEFRPEPGGNNVLVLFGPSGSGKSITLKAIAGIFAPDSGRIVIGEKVVYDSQQKINLKPQQRRVGYVPQNYALFPHLNVAENISYGLIGLNRSEIVRRVKNLLELMQLQDLEQRKPRQLSGGQQQRIALARALAIEPPLLLLDEPFSALDANIRQQLREEMLKLSRRLAIPIVFVTHDLDEAYVLADRIAVYNQGKILQYGSRHEIFYRPNSEDVARLLGNRNLLSGEVLEVNSAQKQVLVQLAHFQLWVDVEAGQVFVPNSKVTLMFRPERVQLLQPLDEVELFGTTNYLKAGIIEEIGRGSTHLLKMRLLDESTSDLPETKKIGKIELEIEVSSQLYDQLALHKQRDWWLRIDASQIHIINQ